MERMQKTRMKGNAKEAEKPGLPEKPELTGKPALIKEVNIGLIKEALEKLGKASRVELAAFTGISQPTVNLLVSRLTTEGVVVSAGMAESTGGRKAEIFTLNRKRFGIVTVIVKEESFYYTVMDMELQEMTKGETKMTGKDRTQQLFDLLGEVLKANSFVGAIALGVPGAVSKEGVVFSIPRMPEWEGSNVKRLLKEKFSMPVVVINDINAIVQGYAAGNSGVQDMIYVHAQNGLGAGILIGGKLYRGFTSFAGEIGYMQVDAPGKERCPGDWKEEWITVPFLTKVLINLICVLNPQQIVLGGEKITEDMFADICVCCRKELPEEVLPRFSRIESGMEYYLYGLGELGRRLLDKKRRIV